MTTKKAAEAVEAVEEVLDAVEAVDAVEVAKKYGAAALALVWVGGVAAGSIVTYLATKKRLEAEYDNRVAEEVQKSIDFLKTQDLDLSNVVVTVDEVEIEGEIVEEPEEPAEEAEEIEEEETEKEGVRLIETKPDISELASRNQATAYHKVFESENANPEKKAEETVPEPTAPEPDFEESNPDISIISRDLFMTNVSEYPQETLTYFSDDAVLDIQGDYVADHERLIGIGRPPFGTQSEDENIIFLRNKKLEKEYELIYDAGEAGEFLRHSLGEMFGRDHRR